MAPVIGQGLEAAHGAWSVDLPPQRPAAPTLALSSSPREDQQIALALIGRLEALHQAVVRELQADHGASRPLISLWSVDADRLLHARNMLSNVDLG